MILRQILFEIPDEIYSHNLIVVFGSQEFAKKRLKRYGIDLDMHAAAGLTWRYEHTGGESMNVIWMPLFDNCIDCNGTLVHEVLHAALFALQANGIKADYNNQEPINYYFTYLYKKVLEKIRAKSKRK